MRILQVITSGEPGGAQTHVGALCEAIAGKVETVVAIGSAQGSSSLGERLAARGIRAVHLPQLRNSTNPLALLRAARVLAALVREARPDVVHAHSSFAGAAARIAAHRCGVPSVYTVHGFGFKPEARPLVREAAWLGEALLARRTSHMICVSRHEAALARALPRPPAALSVIHNGLPDVPHRASPGADAASIAFVARLAPPKRADLLIDALGLMPSAVPAEIIGDGPGRAGLEARARDRRLSMLSFAGAVGDVPARLARHAIFALFSDHEGLPISVIEAMRAGMAIVATRLPGIEEMLVHEESALFVPNESGAIAAALSRLAGDAPLRARLGAAARARYESEFTVEAMARRVLAVYASLPGARA